ncbi:MAG TPA: molybdopterin-dependent oxidoreductase [Acidobacteriaceae bacterium]|nr:molybdopterin-dependent oxidoreductase [Acidobacteriaceae bacterium]
MNSSTTQNPTQSPAESPTRISRRKLITGGLATVAGASGLWTADRLARRYGLIPPDHRGFFGAGETLTYAAQRLLTVHSLAREFPRSMISKAPFANEVAPPNAAFKAHQANGFRDWRLVVDGMVAHPLSLSLSDLRSMPSRSQITEVVCEEGWSYIAEWIGTPLHEVLREAEPLPQVRYIFYDSIEHNSWDSLDMADALHPQTFLTWGMNDGDLPVRHGGPLRMRVPRQLGYKSLKYVVHLTATDSMKKFGKGLGSVSPEYGYAWYAGI